MKRILVKIGKVWSLIKRDGLWRALRRSWYFFLGSLKPVGEGEVLFITGGIGDSALYRGEHVAQELNHHGFVAKTTTQDNPFLKRYIDRFDVFVLHRVSCTRAIIRFMEQAHQSHKTVLFETDDLTFDPAMIVKTSAYQNMNVLEKEQYKEGQSRCVIDNPFITSATTTTKALASHIQQAGVQQVFVVPNKLSDEFVAIGMQARADVQGVSSHGKVRIGYFSGSATHDRDFAVVADVLVEVMEAHPEVEFFVAGPLGIDERFEHLKERIIRSPYVSREEHFSNIAQCDINIAPLEIGDPFCESKSAIKFLEAGIVQTVTVASATQEYSEQITQGVNGFVATDAQEWRTYLERLITDHNLRQKMAIAAYDTVCTKHVTASAGNNAYYDYLRHMIDGSSGESLLTLTKKTCDTVVIIANWNGLDHLKTCLTALGKQSDQNFHTIVVDNGSQDASLAYIKNHHPDVDWILLPQNTGFAHANNVGIRAAFTSPHVKFIIALNNDTDLDVDYIKIMRATIHRAQKEGVAALQPKVLNFFNKERLDATGVVTAFEMSALNRGRNEIDQGQYDLEKEIFGPSASAALYTREALEGVRLPYAGFFDRDYFAYYEDVDLAWRLHLAGYRTLFVPEALVYHVHSATGKNFSPFKAFYIHRNHFYNIIKNAPLPYAILIFLFMPMRYVLLIGSIFLKKGPSAKLHTGVKNDTKCTPQDHVITIVVRAWKDVLLALPQLLRKRKSIAKRSRSALRTFGVIIYKHHTKIKAIIFQ